METDNSEECRIYILRQSDQSEWSAKAQSGDEAAKLCLLVASNFMKNIANEPLHCGCCETLFSQAEMPRAFIVVTSIEYGSANVRAHTMGACRECVKQDDRWLIEHGPKRKGLPPDSPRENDKIH